MIMAVSFTRYGRLYYLDPGGISPRVGDKVLVPTEYGPEVAECVWPPQYVSEDIEGLPVCQGFATEEHLARDEANRRRRAEAKSVSRRLIKRHGLPMKVVAVDYLDAENVFTVYFSAPHRVDFRALVRDLARNLRARVELRQIGPRDEARLQGGIGPCGRELCCATFLKDFEPVWVRMAKDQDLPVNPLRIAGACGRLMCCLKYEHPLYQEFRESAPPVGAAVDTPEGPGTVVGHNVPTDSVVVRLDQSGRRCVCPRASVCASRKEYEARYGEADPAEAMSVPRNGPAVPRDEPPAAGHPEGPVPAGSGPAGEPATARSGHDGVLAAAGGERNEPVAAVGDRPGEPATAASDRPGGSARAPGDQAGEPVEADGERHDR
ncbi:MAG: regulatory iron-sulfur-containing complex subunit RicT [Thermobispora sp.]|nr:regulatory iron-sulfur-containing complex subunit RicT [Thermobispora sp.]